MGKQQKIGVVVRVALAVAIASFGLVVAASSAGAEDQINWVTPFVDHACPSGANLVAAWGYTSTGPQVTITQPDGSDDPDGDNDDNFFAPDPANRSQTQSFSAGTPSTPTTVHGAATTTSAPADNLTWTLGATTSSPPLTQAVNCADLSVTKSQAVDTVTTGTTQTYAVAVANSNTSSKAAGFSVTDHLSSTSVTGVTASLSGGTCTIALPDITCSSSADFLPGATATINISLTPTSGTSLSDQATVSSATYDPNTSNNISNLVTAALAAPGGPTGGGVLSQGQQLKFADPAVNGTVKVTTGTLALTADVGPCLTGIPTISCKSEGLNMDPHSVPNGQIVTEVFNSGRPSPFVPFWKVKFFYYKSDHIDHPLLACPHYLVPKPPPSGTICEYFRTTNLHGDAIVYAAVGADDSRMHR